MWTVIKFDKKRFNILKKDFAQMIGEDTIIYNPKLFLQ